MILLFVLTAMVLLALCFPWKGRRLGLTFGLVSLLSFGAITGYFMLGYPQAYTLKILLSQIDEDPMSVDYIQVHELLDQHLFWHPEDALAQTFEGRLYFSEENFEQSAQSFAKAYALLSDDVDLWVEYATALYLTGQNPKMLAKLVRDLLDHENMPYSAHSLMANIAMDQGELELAKAHWEALLRSIPKDSEEAIQIKRLLQEPAV